MLTDTKKVKEKQFLEALFIKCQLIQTENDRCVHRLNKIKRLIKRGVKDVTILKSRLDKYDDDWRLAPAVAPHRTRKSELKKVPKPKVKTEQRGRPSSKKRVSEKSLKQKILNKLGD